MVSQIQADGQINIEYGTNGHRCNAVPDKPILRLNDISSNEDEIMRLTDYNESIIRDSDGSEVFILK